jgi:hypothetical protein
MISIMPTNEMTPVTSYPAGNGHTHAIDREKEFYIEVHRPTPVKGSFDLFAEARQIYVRARINRRAPSSSIV